SLAFSPDGGCIACACTNSTILVWDVRIDEHYTSFSKSWNRHSGPVTAVAFSPAGKHLISGSEDGSVRIWDINTGTTIGILQGTQPVQYVAVSPDGSRIVTGSDDGTVRVWD
ncbi:WD40 repeat-like protein, partial [Auricularia subglabra TFB-10046 SS5]